MANLTLPPFAGDVTKVTSILYLQTVFPSFFSSSSILENQPLSAFAPGSPLPDFLFACLAKFLVDLPCQLKNQSSACSTWLSVLQLPAPFFWANSCAQQFNNKLPFWTVTCLNLSHTEHYNYVLLETLKHYSWRILYIITICCVKIMLSLHIV